MAKRKNYEPEFWQRVDQSGGDDACWLWLAHRIKKGYGQFWYEGQAWASHRLAYTFVYGPVSPALSVCHNCPTGDNPACCNPRHLWLGTRAENVADMDKKGRRRPASGDNHGLHKHPERIARGERIPQAKLTSVLVREIRSRYRQENTTCHHLAIENGVADETIRRAVMRESWRHVE